MRTAPRKTGSGTKLPLPVSDASFVRSVGYCRASGLTITVNCRCSVPSVPCVAVTVIR